MYCNDCGTKNPDGSRFCAHCGHALSALDTTPPGGASTPASTQRAPGHRRSFPVLPIAGGVLIVALLLGWVYISISLLGDSPEKAAREWLQASATLDGTKIAERTCTAQQANVQQAGLMTSVFNIFGQQTIGQESKTDISDLKFTTAGKSGDTAQVHVTGQIRVAVLALSQTQEVDETWRMMREDGKWKWCGQVITYRAFTSEDPPALVIQPNEIPAKLGYSQSSGDVLYIFPEYTSEIANEFKPYSPQWGEYRQYEEENFRVITRAIVFNNSKNASRAFELLSEWMKRRSGEQSQSIPAEGLGEESHGFFFRSDKYSYVYYVWRANNAVLALEYSSSRADGIESIAHNLAEMMESHTR